MNDILLITKCLILLYRESKIPGEAVSSYELVKKAMDSIKPEDGLSLGMFGDREAAINLKNTVLDMLNNPSDYDYVKEDLLQRVSMDVRVLSEIYTSINLALTDTLTLNNIKRSAANLRKDINRHFKEKQIAETIYKASSALKFQRDKIEDINVFTTELTENLSKLNERSDVRDPAIISVVNVSNADSMNSAFNTMVEDTNGSNIYATGWHALNRMLCGGFRVGLSVVGALQHKYKTGFTLSIFSQIALQNTPVLRDPNKKPLLLRISFEDKMDDNVKFLYQYLKHDETNEYVAITQSGEPSNMSDYVKTKLTSTGFEVMMIHVNPDAWSYKDLFDYVTNLETEGYEIKVLMLDYLSKISTRGCTTSGIAGADVVELFSKVRNFCISKNIVGITPHQLSTEAKMLIRNGLPEDTFVKTIASLGYYEKSRSLDTVVDLELYIHLFKHNGETLFSVQRGKSRGTPITSEQSKYFMLRFPKSMPIASDIAINDTSITKLPNTSNGNGGGY
jgi:hypothetical protein